MKSNKEQNNIPSLRFPEFRDTGVWESKELGDCLDYSQPTKYLVNSTEYSDKYQTPVLTAGKTFILGYTNEKSGVFSEKLPAIIFDDFTTATKFVDFPFKAKSSAMKILLAKKNINIKFIYEVMQNIKYETGVHKRQWISVFSKFKILAPKPQEQQKIADCLSSLDELIEAQAKKVETLKEHKKGLMQKLFPTEGKTEPNLRFPEFRDAGVWESKSFDNVCVLVRGPFGGSLKKDIFVKNGFAVYEQSHAIHNSFNKFRYFINKNKFDELKRFELKPNDIIMSCSGTMGRFAIVPENAKSGIINQALLKITTKKNISVKFIKNLFETTYIQEKLLSQSAGGAIKNVVSVGQIKEINIMVPKLHEQQKIADCLSSLDELIEAQAKKVETLKEHKKGLMQQLFPSSDGV